MMKKLEIKNLLESNFEVYGRYADLLNPSSPYIGEDPVRFYRDMMPLSGDKTLSVSVTKGCPMPHVIDVLEYHSYTGECFLTLDGDTYIGVAPANSAGKPEMDQMEVFYVPRGCAVYLHPGVWHYAPYPAGEYETHTLVLLPERTYANDCYKYELSEEEKQGF